MADIKLIVFDWDGTLSDSADRIVQAVHVGAQQVGFPTRTDQQVRDIIGLGLIESFRTLYPEISEEQLEPFSVAYRDAYLDPDRVALLFDGARETLDELRECGYTLAIATGKSRSGLDRELIETNLTNGFASTRCADETAAKPDPRMLFEVLEETGFAAEQALMIGDTDHDIHTARNAGVLPIAVTCGAQLRHRIEAAEPAAVLDNVTELSGWLAK